MKVLKLSEALEDPNGTRPAMHWNLQVVSTGRNTMRISGRYVTFEGYESFVWNGRKVPAGSAIEVEVQGNGAYSRPYPTFSNP